MNCLNPRIAAALAADPRAKTAHAKFYEKQIKLSEKDKLTDLFDRRMSEAGFFVLDSGDASKPAGPHLLIHREVKFSTRGWKFDRAIESLKIAIEIEGGIWMKGGGAHSRPQNILRDIEKYNAATLLGWRVLRFASVHLQSPYVVECVQRALTLRGG